jgi:hypothetical protein
LKIAGISALGLGTQPVIHALAAEASHGPQPSVRKRESAPRQTLGHGDRHPQIAARAEDMEPLIEACNKIHNVPTPFENKNHEIKWIWETHYHNAFPDKTNATFSTKRFSTARFWCCATTARILPACGPARPRRPSSGKATASSDGFPPLHRLPLLHGGLPLRLPAASTSGIRAPLSKSRTKHSPPV